MSGPEWDTVKRVLADALEREPAERAAFLDAACGDDATLRAEVDSLLPEEEMEESFLARPATRLFDVPALEAGAALGDFRLGRLLGEGGMGRVYEATQEHPRRTVALKVLRPGFLAKDAERRFEWEVEALARLSHPAIASVLEAGTADLGGSVPVPWFAMEKVEGRSLLQAADALALERRARLELFARVCDGVAHAHQRGVIHRDLKPDNVLVDQHGAPHILDFGIARATDPLASSVTTAGEVLGTLAFMAPEQLLGDSDRIDVRTDVYALGGMLYRLLTGCAPHDLEGLSLPQVAVELDRQDATPASHFDRSLAGDLETILATALERDPERRYVSVEALAGDVRRHLADEPITARPATTLYQLAKLARRHRGLAAGLALSFVLLIAAVVGTSIGLVRAERARTQAEEALVRVELERDRFRSTNRLLTAMFESADPEMDGRDVRVVDLLDTAGAELAANDVIEPAVRAALHLTLGKSYQRLGFADEGRVHLGHAIDLFDATDGAVSPLAIEARAALADLHYNLGDVEAGRSLEDQVREHAGELADPPAWVLARPTELAAERLHAAGERDEALAKSRWLHAFWSARRSEDADSFETAANNLAVQLLERGEVAEAEEHLRAAVASRIARLGEDDPSALTQRANLASALTDLGRAREAHEILREVVPRIRAAFGERHATTLSARNNLATALADLGENETAIAIYEELLAAAVARYGADHRETWIARNNLAVTAIKLGRADDAERELRAALDSIARSGAAVDPVFAARVGLNLASALDSAGRHAEAEPLSARGLAQLEELLGAAALPTLIARNNHALLLVELDRATEAVPHARANLEAAHEHLPGHPMNVFPLESNLARILSAAGEHDEALTRFRSVEAHLVAEGEDRASDLARCRELLQEAVERAANDE
ncbi:MAG: serine/threonine protein kinase [bacterium]|nr:serine/threonine protein kinase [bacterium]